MCYNIDRRRGRYTYPRSTSSPHITLAVTHQPSARGHPSLHQVFIEEWHEICSHPLDLTGEQVYNQNREEKYVPPATCPSLLAHRPTESNRLGPHWVKGPQVRPTDPNFLGAGRVAWCPIRPIEKSPRSGGPKMSSILNRSEVAVLLQVSDRTIDRWAAEGRLNRIRLSPRTTRYRLDDVQRLVEECQSVAAAPV
jgi:excisionase family DNA binding protein